jgi:hypothetical protein
VDKIINMMIPTTTSSLDVNINNSIPTQSNGCILCMDKNNNQYIVFCIPVSISVDISKNFLTNPITDSIDYSKYYFVPPVNIVNQTSSMDQIYIDCNPTGESEETIKTYNLPIHSDLMNEIQNSSIVKMTIHFCFFTVGLVLCYFGVPLIYNIIKQIDFNDNDKYFGIIPLKNGGLFNIIGVIFCLLPIFLTSMGFFIQNYIMTGTGLLFAVFTLISISRISELKRDGDANKSVSVRSDIGNIMTGITVGIWVVSWIILGFIYGFGVMSNDNNPFKTATNQFIFLVIFLTIFVGPFISVIYAINQSSITNIISIFTSKN